VATPVLPVFVTGLYCGNHAVMSEVEVVSVLPVFVTGLYCGPERFSREGG
jgi:hypothetical protein